jgi:hypothetical protein
LILIRLAILALSGFFFLAVTATALAGFLVLTGAPKPCVDRAVQPAPAPNAALQANWNDVAARVDAGEAVALSVTEQQATDLAAAHLADKDVPVEDLAILFCPDGSTEAFGKVSIAGLSSDVLVKGHLDIYQEHPTVAIEAIKAGNLPNVVAQNLLDLIWQGDEARTLPLTLKILSVDVSDGEAVVVVGP